MVPAFSAEKGAQVTYSSNFGKTLELELRVSSASVAVRWSCSCLHMRCHRHYFFKALPCWRSPWREENGAERTRRTDPRSYQELLPWSYAYKKCSSHANIDHDQGALKNRFLGLPDHDWLSRKRRLQLYKSHARRRRWTYDLLVLFVRSFWWSRTQPQLHGWRHNIMRSYLLWIPWNTTHGVVSLGALDDSCSSSWTSFLPQPLQTIFINLLWIVQGGSLYTYTVTWVLVQKYGGDCHRVDGEEA